MTAKNDITGDSLKTKSASAAYRAGWDLIFLKPKLVDQIVAEEISKQAEPLIPEKPSST